MHGAVHVILNPAAAGGRGVRVGREVERERGARARPYSIEETLKPGHATELARAASLRGAQLVVAVGGDGTVHEVANGLLAACTEGGRAALAVVPTGTGNDFAKLTGAGSDRSRALQFLSQGSIQLFDAGLVRWQGGSEFFANSMGTGIDVAVVRQREQLPHIRGTTGYLLALLVALARFRPVPLRISADGQVWEQEVMIAAVTNGPCVGGGFYLNPDARPDDGRFDLCMIERLKPWQIARLIPRVLRGTHAGLPYVTMQRGEKIRMESLSGQPLSFNLDGELREPGSGWLEVELVRAALPVLVGPAGRAP